MYMSKFTKFFLVAKYPIERKEGESEFPPITSGEEIVWKCLRRKIGTFGGEDSAHHHYTPLTLCKKLTDAVRYARKGTDINEVYPIFTVEIDEQYVTEKTFAEEEDNFYPAGVANAFVQAKPEHVHLEQVTTTHVEGGQLYFFNPEAQREHQERMRLTAAKKSAASVSAPTSPLVSAPPEARTEAPTGAELSSKAATDPRVTQLEVQSSSLTTSLPRRRHPLQVSSLNGRHSDNGFIGERRKQREERRSTVLSANNIARVVAERTENAVAAGLAKGLAGGVELSETSLQLAARLTGGIDLSETSLKRVREIVREEAKAAAVEALRRQDEERDSSKQLEAFAKKRAEAKASNSYTRRLLRAFESLVKVIMLGLLAMGTGLTEYILRLRATHVVLGLLRITINLQSQIFMATASFTIGMMIFLMALGLKKGYSSWCAGKKTLPPGTRIVEPENYTRKSWLPSSFRSNSKVDKKDKSDSDPDRRQRERVSMRA